MKVCLRLSKEVFDFFDINEPNRKYLLNKPCGSYRLRYKFSSDVAIPLGKKYCRRHGYTLVRLKTLKELMLLPTDEVRQAYLDSIKTKRK